MQTRGYADADDDRIRTSMVGNIILLPSILREWESYTDYSFTVASSNSFFESLGKILPIAQENKYFGNIWGTFFLFYTKAIFTRETALSHLMTKPTKWDVRPARTQIAPSIRPVWAHCVGAQADLSLRWLHVPFCCFCMRWLI